MPIDISSIQFDGDATELQKAVDLATRKLEEYGQGIKGIQRVSVGINSSGEAMVKSLTAVADTNERVTASFEQTKTGIDLSSLAISQNIQQLERQQEKAREAAEAQRELSRELAQSKKVNEQGTNSFNRIDRRLRGNESLTKQFQGASQSEVTSVQNTRAQLRKLVTVNREAANNVDKIFKDLSNGIIGSYTGTKKQVQDLLQQLGRDYENLGNKAQQQEDAVTKNLIQESQKRVAQIDRELNERRQAIARAEQFNIGSANFQGVRNEIRQQSSGPDAGNATTIETSNLQEAESRLQQYLQRSEATADRILSINRELNDGISREVDKRFTKEDVELRKHIQAVRNATARLGQSYRQSEEDKEREVSNKAKAYANEQQLLKRNTEQALRSISKINNATQRAALIQRLANGEQIRSLKLYADELADAERRTGSLRFSWNEILRITTISVAYRAVFGLTNAIQQALTTTTELQVAIAEVLSVSAPTDRFEEFLDVLTETADKFPIGVLEQAEIAYQALSNQVISSVDDSREFLETVNELAVITKSTGDTAVSALTGAMNAYNLSVADAEVISAKLFQTIDLGRLRLEDLADIGNISVIASQLGVSLDEVLAAQAALTIQGIKSSEANTQLRGIFIKLLKPTEAMKDLFRELGVSTGEAAVATFGFERLIELLGEKTQGSTTEIAELINRVRGLSGTLGLQNTGAVKFREALEQLNDISLDARGLISYRERVQEVLDNTGTSIRQAGTRIQSILIKEITFPFQESARALTNNFDNIVNTVEFVARGISVSLIPAVTGLTIVMGRLAVSSKVAGVALKSSFDFVKGNAVVIGISVLAGVFARLASASTRETERIRNDFTSLKTSLADEVTEIGQIIKRTTEAISIGFQEISSQVFPVVAQISVDLQTEYNTILNNIEEFLEDAESAQKDYETALKRSNEEVQNSYRDTENQVRSLQGFINGISENRGAKEFSLSLIGQDDETRLGSISQRITELRGQLQESVQLNNAENFNQLTSEINSLFDQRVSLLTSISGDDPFVDFDSSAVLSEYQALTNEQEQAARSLEEHNENLLETKRQEIELAKELNEQRQKALDNILSSEPAKIFELDNPEEIVSSLDRIFDAFDELKSLDVQLELPKDTGLENQINALREAGIARLRDLDIQQQIVNVQEDRNKVEALGLEQKANAERIGRERNEVIGAPGELVEILRTQLGETDILEGLRQPSFFSDFIANNQNSTRGPLPDISLETLRQQSPEAVQDFIANADLRQQQDLFEKALDTFGQIPKGTTELTPEQFADNQTAAQIIDALVNRQGVDTTVEKELIKNLDLLLNAPDVKTFDAEIFAITEAIEANAIRVQELNEDLSNLTNQAPKTAEQIQQDSIREFSGSISSFGKSIEGLRQIIDSAVGTNSDGSLRIENINIEVETNENGQVDIDGLVEELRRRGTLGVGV